MTDLFIAVGLVAVVVVVYLIYRMGVLPKKSLPFVIGGLVGILGITIFRERRMKGLRQDLERREKRLKEMEERLQLLKKHYGASEEKLNEVKAELERQRAAYEKNLLKIKAETKEEKERIDGLSGEELFDEFRNSFGNP